MPVDFGSRFEDVVDCKIFNKLADTVIVRKPDETIWVSVQAEFQKNNNEEELSKRVSDDWPWLEIMECDESKFPRGAIVKYQQEQYEVTFTSPKDARTVIVMLEDVTDDF